MSTMEIMGPRKRKQESTHHQSRINFRFGSPFQLVLEHNVADAHVVLVANGEQVLRGLEWEGGLNDILPSFLRDHLGLGGGFPEESIVITELSALINHKSSANRVVFVGGQHVSLLIKNSEAHSVWMLGQTFAHVEEQVLRSMSVLKFTHTPFVHMRKVKRDETFW